MAVDLHLHSSCSDGSDTPAELVGLASETGLTAMALTDHDTLDGIDAARTAATAAGIDFIPGTELSIDWATGTMHMLVYFLEPGPGPLQDELSHLRDARGTRNEQMIERLNAMGIPIRYDDVVAESGGGVVGRPHIAAVLVSMGHATDPPEAFDRYLASGRPAYVGRERLDADTALRLAWESGGVPVVAHPHTLGASADDYKIALESLADRGLGGVEAWYSEYPPALREHLAALAGRLGLVATGGSDHHGSYKPHLGVGIGRGDLDVPDDAADALRAVRIARARPAQG